MKTEKTCCVFGHRKITEKEEIRKKLSEIFDMLITKEAVTTFLLGSKSEFNDLCCDVLRNKKEQFPHIQRVYVRAEYPDINDHYERYLLKHYDNTYFPKRLRYAGKAVYVERNYEMIDQAHICVVYYKADYFPSEQKISGTKIAYKYAEKKKKRILNLSEDNI